MLKKIVLFVGLSFLLAGCGENTAVRSIEALGFTNVQLTGSAWVGCSDSDDLFWSHKFSALGANGKPITGVACGGLLKGYTIRTW